MTRTAARIAALFALALFVLAMRPSESAARLIGSGIVPVITSITGQDTSGGPITITGTGFGAGSTNLNAVHVWCDVLVSSARPAPPNREFLPVVSLSSTQVVATAGSYDAGTYDCRVENVGGASAVAPKSLVIASTSNPSVVFGAQLDAWWRSDSGVTCAGVGCANGGLVSGWVDKTANAYALAASGSARGVYATSSASFESAPSVTFDGAASTIVTTTSVTLGSTTQECLFVVYREVTTAANKNYFGLIASGGTPVYHLQANGTNPPAPELLDTGGTATQAATVPVGTAVQLYGCINGSGHNVAVNNAVPNATSFSDSVASGLYSVFIGGTGSNLANIEVVEAFLVSGVPTSTQLLNVATYENLRYGLGSPQPTLVTNIPIAGGGYRVKGTSFLSGATISVAGGLESSTSAGFNGATSIESTVGAGTYAAGAYDVTVVNPDGGNSTLIGGLHVTTALDPMTIAGLSVIGWYDLDSPYVTLSGSTVSGLLDRSFLGNDLVQPTGADQPTYAASDAAYAGHGSATFDGSATFLYNVAASADGASASWLQGIVAFDAANTNIGDPIADLSNGQFSEIRNQHGVPNCNRSATTAAWGSTQSGAARSITCSVPAGANPTISLNVSNGTAVTASATANAVNTTRQFGVGARQNNGTPAVLYKGSGSKFVVLNATPSGGQQTQFETWAQGYGAP